MNDPFAATEPAFNAAVDPFAIQASESTPKIEVDALRVTIVEENPAMRLVLEFQLRKLDHTVRPFSQLDKRTICDIRDNPPDLLIIGLESEPQRAFMLCSKIRSLDVERRSSIVIAAKDLDTQTMLDGLELGVDGFLVKPYDDAGIRACISRFAAQAQGVNTERQTLSVDHDGKCYEIDANPQLLVSGFVQVHRALWDRCRVLEQEGEQREVGRRETETLLSSQLSASHRDLETIKRGKQEWESAVDSLDEIVAIIGDDGRILRLNRAAEKWGFGPVQDLVGKPVQVILPSGYVDNHEWVGAMAHEPDVSGNAAVVTTCPGVVPAWSGWCDREERFVVVNAHAPEDRLDARGYMVVVVEDATVRHRAEMELEQSRERTLYVKKMESVGRMAGGIAHDFNNILTAIKGHAQLVLGDLNPEEMLYGDLKEILEATERAEGLTQQLLAFSRRQVISAELVDLNALTVGLEKLLRRLGGEGVHINTRFEARDVQVSTDPTLVERMLVNLVVNAKEAMVTGGEIDVAVSTRTIEEHEVAATGVSAAGPYAALSVRDEGSGMSPDVVQQIFEPFFSTKVKGKGTGLGLSTVYGNAKQMGGTVLVDSVPGQGTTMSILLPLVRESVSETPLDDVAERAGAETMVLLVEDDAQVRKVARRILERINLVVVEAEAPAQAEELWRKHRQRIGLLVTDVVMPGMTGTEFAARLRQSAPELPVIYMSGYTDKAVSELESLPDNSIFLQKPFTPDLLGQAVKEILTSEA